jgi:hypothetical protein
MPEESALHSNDVVNIEGDDRCVIFNDRICNKMCFPCTEFEVWGLVGAGVSMVLPAIGRSIYVYCFM